MKANREEVLYTMKEIEAATGRSAGRRKGAAMWKYEMRRSQRKKRKRMIRAWLIHLLGGVTAEEARQRAYLRAWEEHPRALDGVKKPDSALAEDIRALLKDHQAGGKQNG